MPHTERIRKQDISNPAKILRGYMQATGISDAKELAETFDIPLRTIQRLKLECAINGVAESANDAKRAISGVPDAPIAPDMAFSEPSLALAHDACVETPSGLLITEVVSISPPPPKSAAGPTPSECLAAFEAYNSVALRCGLPQASKLTPKRAKAIRARVKEFGAGSWERALANLEQSKFLCGETKENFRADLDFVCQAKSFARLHDGGYGNGRHVKSVQSQITVKPPEPDWLRRQRFEREILEINGEV